jgi:type VI secretion system protein ImpA
MSDQDALPPSHPVIDIDSLLKPCPGTDRAGISISYGHIYDRIQELRRADEVLSAGEWQRNAKKSDWKAVIRVAQEVLATQSKDLMVALWLWEALTHQYGFSGLRDGCRVVTRLIDEYWEDLYPKIEEGDLEVRAGKMEWIERVLVEWARVAPLFVGGNRAVSISDWQAAENIERKNERERAEFLQEGKQDFGSIKRILVQVTSSHLKQLEVDLLDAQVAVTQFDSALHERFQDQAPSLQMLVSTMHQGITIIQRAILVKGGSGKAGDGVSEQESDPKLELIRGEMNSDVLLSDPTDREDALQRLQSLAYFFEKTEPYSPVPYAIRRAIRWAHMPLEQWLAEVIPDEETLRSIRRSLGVDNSGEGE